MMNVFKAIVFGVGCFLLVGTNDNTIVTGFRPVASTKSAVSVTKTRLLQRQTYFSVQLQQQQQQQRRKPQVFRMSNGDETADKSNADTTEGTSAAAVQPTDTTTNSGDLVDVVTTSFSSEYGGDIGKQDVDDNDEINPIVAAGVILGGLVFSFALLYYELQQARFIN